MDYLVYIAIGLVAGVCSGLFGIGGGIIIVPLLVYFTNAPQHKAVGTSLIALLLPVGALAAWQYYKSGKIGADDALFGLLIAGGLFIGAFAGSKLGLSMQEAVLRKAFAIFVMLVGARMFIKG